MGFLWEFMCRQMVFLSLVRERLKLRMREDDSQEYSEFERRDKHELGFGIGTVIALSDKLIINESDLESFQDEINEFFSEIGL